MSDRPPSRRDLFRLLGRSLAGLRGEGTPPAPAAPPAEAALEGGRLVVDLARHPVPPGAGRRFAAPGLPWTVLLARVTADHVAAVTGDCPHCGGALAFDVGRDAVLCPSGAAAFRLDGSALAGPPGLRLASLPVRRAGPRIEIDLA